MWDFIVVYQQVGVLDYLLYNGLNCGGLVHKVRGGGNSKPSGICLTHSTTLCQYSPRSAYQSGKRDGSMYQRQKLVLR
jgi:hypothetical protein